MSPRTSNHGMQEDCDGASVRRATESDIPEIRHVIREAYKRYVPRIGQLPAPMTDNYSSKIAEGHVWVLMVAAELAGVLVLKPESTHMLLENVAVKPERQGEGFGRLLIHFAEARARESGYREIQLYTNVAMHENLALYPTLGYQEFHRGYESGFHRVFFKKTLGQ